MNEGFFFLQIGLIILFLLFALRLGKEALIAFFATSAIFANLFVTKQITLFHAHVTASDAYAVSCILSLNLLQEFFGKKWAKKAIWIAFFLLLYLAVMSQVHLLYRPNSFDQTSDAFAKVFGIAPRLFAASLFVFFLVQRIDVQIFGWLRKKFSESSFFFRMGGSFIISQFLDTVLFSFLGLYGIVENVLSIILVSYLIKMCVFSIMTPFLYVTKFSLGKR